jgi:hypothetical protein
VNPTGATQPSTESAPDGAVDPADLPTATWWVRPAAVPGSPPEPRRDAHRLAHQAVATLFAVAFVSCVMVEPLPNGPHPEPPMWTLPIEIAAFAAVVIACVALWRRSSRARVLGLVAGAGMAVGTVVCPGTGHHVVGWYTWVQAGLTLFVLLTSAALPRALAGITWLTRR